MSNTQRFSPAPPAPGSAPVPAASESRVMPLNAPPSDEFSAAERAFFGGGEPVASDAVTRSWNDQANYPERVAWWPEPTRGGEEDQVDDRHRNTAKALRNVVVVNKRRLPPSWGAADALPALNQSSNGVLAVAAICSMAAVFLVCLRSSQHLETRVSSASVRQFAASPAAAPASLPTITPAETLLSARSVITADSSAPRTSQPASSAAPSALAASAAPPLPRTRAVAREADATRAKSPARPFAAKPAKPDVSSRAVAPARTASWLDTPIAPPED